MAVKIQSEIRITVGLDENRVPETMHWDATDGGVSNEKAKAMMLSIWDAASNDTLRIDLWTKDMLMDDMKRFYHQTFLAMADSFERATNETAITADLRDFAAHFAEKMKLINSSGR